MRKTAVLLAILASLICLGLVAATAQDSKEPPKPQPSAERQVNAYHLDFSISELEEGKKINTRHYSMNLATQNGFGSDQLKIGSRVPTQVEDGKYEYLDIGTSITVRMQSSTLGPSPVTINVDADISSFADPEQAKAAGHPLIRQMHLSGSTIVSPDKLMVLGSADDPQSKREFQLTVIASKINP